MMMPSTTLSNEIIDVSSAILDDFPSSYILLIETPLTKSFNMSEISKEDYEDYLETISLQLLSLYEMPLQH